MIKGSHHSYLTINYMNLKYVRQKSTTGKNWKFTFVVRNFNISRLLTGKMSKQKIKKNEEYVNNVNSKHDSRVMLIPLKKTHAHFSNTRETFTNIHHIFGQKTSLYSFKRTEIIQSMFSNCHELS